MKACFGIMLFVQFLRTIKPNMDSDLGVRLLSSTKYTLRLTLANVTILQSLLPCLRQPLEDSACIVVNTAWDLCFL